MYSFAWSKNRRAKNVIDTAIIQNMMWKIQERRKTIRKIRFYEVNTLTPKVVVSVNWFGFFFTWHNFFQPLYHLISVWVHRYACRPHLLTPSCLFHELFLIKFIYMFSISSIVCEQSTMTHYQATAHLFYLGMKNPFIYNSKLTSDLSEGFNHMSDRFRCHLLRRYTYKDRFAIGKLVEAESIQFFHQGDAFEKFNRSQKCTFVFFIYILNSRTY